MPINGKALLDAAVILSEQEQWRLTVGYSTATGVVNALSGLVGWCSRGPAGCAIGVGLSAVSTYYFLTKNKYKPVSAILKEDLRLKQQEELIRLLKEAFQDVCVEDVLAIVQLMVDKREMGVTMKEIVISYLYKQFALQVSNQSENNDYVTPEKMVL